MASPGQQKRAIPWIPVSPRLSFYLRDCGAEQKRRRMPLRWTAPNALGRPLSRLVTAPAQSWVPERLRELRLRRRVPAYIAGNRALLYGSSKVTGGGQASAKQPPAAPPHQDATARAGSSIGEPPT